MKVKLIWYTMEEEKATDIFDNVSSKEEAIQKGYLKYNGNPPGPCVSAIELED